MFGITKELELFDLILTILS